MALGVLNNLSAMFAANNLNNTQNSLNTTLQQLSSGSKINSGADDAAGLSLVDGLAANSAALSQSSVNATEGVGLLQVADGSLSQVTSLLNRAVTLATEASNGTLNSSQQAATNQEYQSILSEIDNIGSTTTYNQEKVFGGNFNIYTGDSSNIGSSIDALSIGSLSSASVGQAGGTMAYKTGGEVIDFGAGTTASAVLAGTGNLSLSNGDTIALGGTTGITSAAALAAAINADGLSATAQTSYGSFSIALGTGVTAGSTVAGTGTLTLANGVTVALTGITSVSGLETAIQGADSTATVGLSGTSLVVTESGVGMTTAPALSAGITVNALAVATTALTSSSDETVTITGGTASLSAGATLAVGTTAATFTNSSATISYAGNAGTDLSKSDLSSSTDAQSALTAINAAISDIASQDGYVGAQINTLNSISSVESTQQNNIVSAQNAVQATDYATATSNLSKYEILTQTGISALAQANSVEQEVTKLLQ